MRAFSADLSAWSRPCHCRSGLHSEFPESGISGWPRARPPPRGQVAVLDSSSWPGRECSDRAGGPHPNPSKAAGVAPTAVRRVVLAARGLTGHWPPCHGVSPWSSCGSTWTCLHHCWHQSTLIHADGSGPGGEGLDLVGAAAKLASHLHPPPNSSSFYSAPALFHPLPRSILPAVPASPAPVGLPKSAGTHRKAPALPPPPVPCLLGSSCSSSRSVRCAVGRFKELFLLVMESAA